MFEKINNLINSKIENQGEKKVSTFYEYNNEKHCYSLLVLSDRKIYIWHNINDNLSVKVKSFDLVRDIQFNGAFLVLALNDEVLKFRVNTATYEANRINKYISEKSKDYIAKYKQIVQLEQAEKEHEAANKKKFSPELIKRISVGLMAIMLVAGLSAGGTLLYLKLTSGSEVDTGEIREEQSNQAKIEIDKARNQISGLKKHLERMESYLVFVETLNDSIVGLEINDEFDYSLFYNNVGDLKIQFNSLKYENEALVDYLIEINYTSESFKDKVITINDTIDSVLSDSSTLAETRFEDISMYEKACKNINIILAYLEAYSEQIKEEINATDLYRRELERQLN